ncbi:hypothetical protein DIPPA_21017 [Diplonema papillatum]|nr:hypothetical protein DIPPA_21017 [Diplonema papillatum]
MPTMDAAAIARKITTARLDGTWVEVEDVAPVQSLEDAYCVHRELLASPALGPRVGWKVGVNNPDGAFKAFGMSEPFVAPLMKDFIRESGCTLDPLRIDTVGVAEGEWAFIMGQALPCKDADPSMPVEAVKKAVAQVGVAIEIAASCVRKGPGAGLVQKIADFGLCHSVVFRPICAAGDLGNALDKLCERDVCMSINGTPVGPAAKLNCVAELHRAIRLLHSHGFSVEEGDLIITGAVVKKPGLCAGDKVSVVYQHPKTPDTVVEVSCEVGEAPKM